MTGRNEMRRLKIQVQSSIDGYMGGPDGGLEWAVTPWSPDMIEYADGVQESVDCILLGRRLAEGFIPAWAASPEAEDPKSVDFMNHTRRVVFSNTLGTSPWENAEVRSGKLDEVVRELKSTSGGDIIAYGGQQLVSGLIRHRLVDELHLMVSPVAIGTGLPIFGSAPHSPFELVDQRKFDCGISLQHYRCT